MKMTATPSIPPVPGAPLALPARPTFSQRWRGAGNLIPALLFLGLFFSRR
jgi:putative spermidine/putrescine transport system permease protein